MKTTIERHPTLQMFLLAIVAVAALYLAASVVDVLAAANAADVVRFTEAGRRRP